MKTIILAPKEVPLSPSTKSKLDMPQYVRADCIQFAISCGRNMFEKSISITLYGSTGEKFIIDKVDLTKMHDMLVDSDIRTDLRWPVSYVEFEPLQADNWPIFVGVNSLNLP